MLARILLLSLFFFETIQVAEGKIFYTINNIDTGAGSFRSAIDSADNNSGYDSIFFNIPGGSVSDRTIHILSQLHIDEGYLFIDGTTQVNGESFGLTPSKIYLKGNGYVYGIDISSDSVSIMGLVIDSFHYGIQQSGAGCRIGGPGKGNVIINCTWGIKSYGSSIHVESNLVGLDTNMLSAPNEDGIYLFGGQVLFIGGPNSSQGNKIAYNTDSGISIVLASAITIQNNEIYNNYVGLEIHAVNFLIGNNQNSAGNYFHNNLYRGIDVTYSDNGKISGNKFISNVGSINTFSCHDLIIGGAYAERNIIDSTIGAGIMSISDSNNFILNNHIINSTGDGIEVSYGFNLHIGDNQGNGNLISGNDHGIQMSYSKFSVITGNLIGTDSTGLFPFGNKNNGINFAYSYYDTIDGNIVSSNLWNGMFIPDSYNTIVGNKIGVGIDGLTPLGNVRDGILANTDEIYIGDGSDKGKNIIAFNEQNGVTSSSTSIRNNSIFCNKLKGINKLNPNPSPAIILYYSATVVSGISEPNAYVEIFQNHECNDDCEGKTFLGSSIADNDGNFIVPNDTLGGLITTTQTDTSGSTSEFSACILIDTLATGLLMLSLDSTYLSPNPASTFSQLHYSLISSSPLVITDAFGRLVKKVMLDASSQSTIITINDLPSGVYFLNLLEVGKRISKKLIVAK